MAGEGDNRIERDRRRISPLVGRRAAFCFCCPRAPQDGYRLAVRARIGLLASRFDDRWGVMRISPEAEKTLHKASYGQANTGHEHLERLGVV